MTKTPRTDKEAAAQCGTNSPEIVRSVFARQLEMELEESRQRNIALILERDRWKAKAEEKIAFRRELESLLGMDSKPASDEQFQKGLNRLRSIVEENKRLIHLLDKSR